MQDNNVGTMIETAAQEAGVKLQTAYRLVMLDVPTIEMGDLTVDISVGSRMFPSHPYRNLMCAIGPRMGTDWAPETINTAAIEEAVEKSIIRPAKVSMKAFNVDLKKSTMKIGWMQPNPSVHVQCLHCRRTYHQALLKIKTKRERFFCRRCFDEAMTMWKSLSPEAKKSERKPHKRMFRLDRDRNVLEYETPTLKDRHVTELVTAAQVPPDKGGVISLPRPFVLFEPGSCQVDWEPEAGDKAAQQLCERCRQVARGSSKGQYPVPLKLVLDAYAPGHDRRPWGKGNQRDIKVPGIIGVHMLVDSRTAGWIPVKELRPDTESEGWYCQMPEHNSGTSRAPAREV